MQMMPRNMCVVGGDSFISTAYDLNVMEALRSLLYKVRFLSRFQRRTWMSCRRAPRRTS